jgi:hypothetical protein
MKRFALLLVSGLFTACFAAPVWAEHFTDYGDPKAGHEQEKMEKMEMKGPKMMGVHKMTGTVENIDYATGTLTLKSGAPDMRLHFPPASVKDLKNGDTITVDLGFTK